MVTLIHDACMTSLQSTAVFVVIALTMHGYHRRQRARTVECNVPIPCDHMDLNVNMLTHLPLTCELMTFASLSTRAELRLNPVRVQREKMSSQMNPVRIHLTGYSRPTPCIDLHINASVTHEHMSVPPLPLVEHVTPSVPPLTLGTPDRSNASPVDFSPSSYITPTPTIPAPGETKTTDNPGKRKRLFTPDTSHASPEKTGTVSPQLPCQWSFMSPSKRFKVATLVVDMAALDQAQQLKCIVNTANACLDQSAERDGTQPTDFKMAVDSANAVTEQAVDSANAITEQAVDSANAVTEQAVDTANAITEQAVDTANAITEQAVAGDFDGTPVGSGGGAGVIISIFIGSAAGGCGSAATTCFTPTAYVVMACTVLAI